MTNFTVRRLAISQLAFATIALATPAISSNHRHTHPDRAHSAANKAKSKPKPSRREKPAPSGAITVPAGGIKVYCAGSRSPLLIRKSTQGNGTTVTVICR